GGRAGARGPPGGEGRRRRPPRGPSGPPAGSRRDRLEDLRLLARRARLSGDDHRREPANAAHAIGPLSAARSPTAVLSLPAVVIARRAHAAGGRAAARAPARPPGTR